MILLRKLIAKLPHRWQSEIKRSYFGLQIKRGNFVTDEPEYKILNNLLKPEDWVIDIGANVGHYTKRFSELVGAQGRVIAFEPVPTTFSLLSANVLLFEHPNVTLINAAVSDKLNVVGMSMPNFSTGLPNYYQAHLSPDSESALSVLAISLDSLCINHNIALVKIDAEGHEAFIFAGMQKLIRESLPYLIVETSSKQIIADLKGLNYTPLKLQNSPNYLFKPNVRRTEVPIL